MKYGIDEYSRYIEIDGERRVVEPWPFWRWRYLPLDFWWHIVARIDVIEWHIGIIRQDGFAKWRELRRY